MVAESVQDRKLFVGGLSPLTSEDGLKAHFEKYGEIVDLVVMKDTFTGHPRGFGFVTYKEASMADAAVSAGPHTLDGKRVDARRAVSKDDIDEVSGPVLKLFVGGLKPDITNEHLTKYFSQFGKLKDAMVMTEKDSNKSRCFAFVTYEDSKSVEEVMNSKPHNLEGAQIDVKRAVSKDDMKRKHGGRPNNDRRDHMRGGSAYYHSGPPGGPYGGYGGWGAPPVGPYGDYGYGGYPDYGYGGYEQGYGYDDYYNSGAPPVDYGAPPTRSAGGPMRSNRRDYYSASRGPYEHRPY